MSIETQLREALAAQAGAAVSAEQHPYERVSAAVAKNRRARRATGAAAVALVAALALGVPAATSHFGDGSSKSLPAGQAKLPSSNDPAWDSIATWPTRGALAGDQALVSALDRKFSGHTLFVEDLGEGRVAVVANDTGYLIFATGPNGAVADISSTMETPVTDYRNGILTVALGKQMVLLTTPDRGAVEVSGIPTVGLDGTVTRTWSRLGLTDGFGRATWGPLTRFRLGDVVGAVDFRASDASDDAAFDAERCRDGGCSLDPDTTRERDANDLAARLFAVDRAKVTTETVFLGRVPTDFGLATLSDPLGKNPRLRVLHTRLPGGQVLRTASVEDDNGLQMREQTRPVDAGRALTTPLLTTGAGVKDGAPTKVNVFVASGTAVRAVSDSPSIWPSSAVVPIANHLAAFEVPVSVGIFDSNYRLEVLEGDRVVNTVRTSRPVDALFDTSQG